MSDFPWIPIYRELAQRLLDYRQRQEGLIAVLSDLREQDLPVILITDKTSEDDDHSIQLSEIDPFTFFASFNRTGSYPSRSKIMAGLKDFFGLQSSVPETFEGIPIVNPQASWFFGYQFKREESDVPLLWDLAEKIVQVEAPGDLPVALFERCLDIHAVGRAKLTMGLFWTRPEQFLPLDKNTRTYLGRRGLDANPAGGEEYVALLEDARQQLGEPFYVISKQAYEEARAAEEAAAQDTSDRLSPPEATPQLPPAGGLDTWQLERAAARTLRPYLVEGGALDDVQVEGYHHATVIPAVQAALTRRRLEEEPVAAASEAIKASSNLLSSYEQMKALALFAAEGPEAVRTHLTDLLYGEDDLEVRLGRALAWGEPRAVDETTQAALNATTATYLLAALRPERYAFCKPTVYAAAARALLGEDAARQDPLERALHAMRFYRAALEALRQQGLPFDDLMHVHIAFFVMQHESTDYPTWDELERLAPPFANVFAGRAEAHWAFDLFRDALGRLGVESPIDERVALTMPDHHDGTVLRLNFCRWLVLDVYGPGTERDGFGMALLEGHLEGAEPRTVSEPFASLSQELPISVHRFAREDVRGWAGNLRAVYEQSFDAIADVFRAWARTPYRGSHRQQILAAVFDETLRERLFDRGLALEEAPPTVSEDDIREHPAGGLLLDRSNVILYGPPGTGKTRMARQLMDRWAAWQGNESVRAVTFHPSYAYEDFIEGFRPDECGQFSRRDGLFVRLCKMAQDAPDQRFLLMIDEINRGDVARLFGELVTLIEPSKRGMRVELPYSQEPFWVPENLYLLGTMNTADRSISLMDIAIRRRFAFKEVAPDASVIEASEAHVTVAGGVHLADLLRGLNARLVREGIDRDRAIGHSFLLIAEDAGDPAAVLRERLRYDIVPLIEEYCYSNRPVVRRILGRLVDDAGRLRGDVLGDPDRLARALRALTPSGDAAPEDS